MIYYYIGGALIGIYALEFIAERLKTNKFRPSYALTQIAAFLTWLTQTIGRAAAYISSFVEYIKGEMFYVPLFKLLKPTYDICISWLWFFTAYFESAGKFANEYVVYGGSFLIIKVLCMLILYYIDPTQTFMDYVYMAFASTMGISLVVMTLYFIGSLLHESIRDCWNSANKNNALIEEGSVRNAQKQASAPPPAATTFPPAPTPLPLPTPPAAADEKPSATSDEKPPATAASEKKNKKNSYAEYR